MGRLILRYPSFVVVSNTILIFLALAMIAFLPSLASLGLSLVFVIPIFIIFEIIIIALLHYVIIFDKEERVVTVKRWFYKYEIPFDILKIEFQVKGTSGGPIIALPFNIAKIGNKIYRLHISDNKKYFLVAESIFRKRIKAVELKIRKLTKEFN